MLELRIKAGRRTLPIFDLPALLGRAGAYREIGDQIDALIAFVDDLAGDPDLEANGDELDGTGAEDEALPVTSASEARAAGCPISDPEEDEDQDRCLAGDDMVRAGPAVKGAAYYWHRDPGNEEDAEPDHDREAFTWPEWADMRQPSSLAGGLALNVRGDDGEPTYAPAHWPAQVEPAND